MFWGASVEAQTPFSFLPKDVGIKGAVFADAGSLWDYKGPTSWNVTGETLDRRLAATWSIRVVGRRRPDLEFAVRSAALRLCLPAHQVVRQRSGTRHRGLRPHPAVPLRRRDEVLASRRRRDLGMCRALRCRVPEWPDPCVAIRRIGRDTMPWRQRQCGARMAGRWDMSGETLEAIGIREILAALAPPLSVPAGRSHHRHPRRRARHRHQERDHQRAALRRPLSRTIRSCRACWCSRAWRRPRARSASARSPDRRKPALVYFLTIDKAKFRKPVVPGDRLEYHMTRIKRRRNMWWYRGEAKVDGELVAEAELGAMIVVG